MLFRRVRKSPPGTYSCAKSVEPCRARDEDTHHCKVNILVVLERVQQTHEPLALGSCQDVSLGQDVADLVQLEQKLLAHYLQGAYLLRVLLLGQEYLTVTTLSDLREDLEVTLSESHTSFSQISPLATGVLAPHLLPGLLIGLGRIRVFRAEGVEATLAIAGIVQQIKVVVKKVWPRNMC